LKNKSLLIVGLGNPGREYSETRHNAGFRVINRFAAKHSMKFRKKLFKPYLIAEKQFGDNRIILIKPYTYMNLSGQVLPHVFKSTRTGIENILVITDQIDLSPGQIRYKTKGSDGGHRGLRSIVGVTGTSDFKRIYIGIGRPDEGVPDHVLGIPSDQDRKDIEKAEIKASDYLMDFLTKKTDILMNEINRKR